mmetsp:Transcript_5509/g.7728  ORF Transcript_5509/g.7728 Transcript_5509/m.7728 type:complete len:344 (-) Transcript_5509:629-1660(-)
MAEKESASLGENSEIAGDMGGAALPDSLDKLEHQTEEGQAPAGEGEKINLDDRHVTERVQPQSREGEMPKMKFVNPFANDRLLETGKQETSEVEYSPEEQAVIDKLYRLQTEADDINAMMELEEKELVRKYNKKFQALFKERASCIDSSALSHFWLDVLKKSKLIADNITSRDEEALKYLADIASDNVAGEGTFTLTFKFSSNPYFENLSLTKVYEMDEEDPDVLTKAVGCPIHWKSGKDLTKRVVRKKIKGPKGPPKYSTKVETCDSFFHLFAPPQMVDDPEEQEIIEDILEADYEIGDRLRSEIIPNAVRWYTGEIQEESEEDDEFDDEDDEEEEEYNSDL